MNKCIGPDLSFIPKTRYPVVHNGLCYILLLDGRIAFCDAEDYGLVKNRMWNADRFGYPWYGLGSIGGHRYIHQALNRHRKMTDHINGNILDNRRVNLRECNQHQNQANRKPTHRTSRYKGVSWDKRRGKWRVKIKCNGIPMELGRFHSEIEAARVYDKKAFALFGEYARPNCYFFPEVIENRG